MSGRTIQDDDDRWTDDDNDDGTCYTCGGQGLIVTCIDDICRGGGECIHGDGEATCPECKGRYL